MENIKELVKQITQFNDEYRKGTPLVSDYEYDKLVERLYQLDPENDWFKKGVQDKAPKTNKEQLTYPMYSLNKCKSLQEIGEWLQKVVGEGYKDCLVVITPKFDGLSIQKEISSGKSWTRGNGLVGQICTDKMAKISSNVTGFDRGFIRGEVLFTQKSWAKFSQQNPDYKNPRNTATGWINGDYKEETPYHYLSYMCYELYASGMDKLQELLELNSKVNTVDCPLLISPFSRLTEENLEKLFITWSEQFPIDGLVIDINSSEYRTGQEANGNPIYARAYKHPNFTEKKQTKITEIEYHVNRNGVVTPILHIEPVELAGATITKVNGINMSYVYDWFLCPGTTITIVRSGEVIPKVIESRGCKIPFREEFKSDKEYQNAYKYAVELFQELVHSSDESIKDYHKFMESSHICPFCDTPLQWDLTQTNLVCPNVGCEERKIQWIADFFKILGVENVKETSFRQLYHNGLNTWDKLLKISAEDLINIDGWAIQSALMFEREMNKIRYEGVPCARLFHASGFFGGLGEKTLQLIIDNLKNPFFLPDTFTEQSKIEELISIKGISEISAKQYLSGLGKYEAVNGFDSLVKITYIKTPQKKEGKLSGQKIAFSGFRDADLKKRLELAGAIVEDNMTKSTTMLIVKDKGQTSSKTQKAMQMGIPIYSQKEIEIDNSNLFE